MASRLKQIYKSALFQSLFLGLIGASSFLAFSPFDLKFILIISHAFLFYAVLFSQSLHAAFYRSLAWGLGYWLGGAGWLIVSIYYYGNTSIYIAFLIIILMAIFLSLIFISPISLIRLVAPKHHYFVRVLLCAGILIGIEFTRFILFGGFPWLLPGLILIDTIGQDFIPLIGVSGSSFVIYFISLFLAFSFNTGEYKKVIFSLTFFAIIIPHQGYQERNLGRSIDIAIIQPALDPFKKYATSYKATIEDALINLSNQHDDVDLLIWQESPFPYLNSSPDMASFLERTKNLPTILSGGWDYQDAGLQNVMSILGTTQSYSKRHLVVFGEYIPFEAIFRGLIKFFDMPMSSIEPGQDKQPLFQVHGNQVLGLICFDAAFPLSFVKEARSADFIVNISNDTWFGSSYGPHQHLQIVRARALEFNRWIARGTSDGISTIVDNKGTIVTKIEKNIQSSLRGRMYRVEEDSYFTKFGFLLIPILSIFSILMTFVLRFTR